MQFWARVGWVAFLKNLPQQNWNLTPINLTPIFLGFHYQVIC